MKIICATHGNLAKGFIDSVRMIAGNEKAEQIIPLCLYDDLTEFKNKCKQCKEMINEDTLVLTDLYGATPFNVCYSYFEGSHGNVISGVNLGMLLEILFHTDTSLPVLKEIALESGKKAISEPKVQIVDMDDFFD